MPKIHLKPQSPEFEDAKPHPKTRHCDMPGCTQHGEFRAPKDRSLSEHYWFCQDHIAEYNKAWNFFEGMNAQEVEDHILNSLYGDRPTRRYDAGSTFYDDLYNQAWRTYEYKEQERPKNSGYQYSIEENRNTPEYEALAIFGLEPPIDLKAIKARYKELAKKHHPDFNPGDQDAEELLKKINMAYTILKLAFEKYEKIEK